MNTTTEGQNVTKPFWDNGHFFRDIALVLIFVQISMEFKDVFIAFDSMSYAIVVVSMAIGDILPFLFKFGWCLVLMAMFLFTLGGTSRWPLMIQIFITIVMMAQYYIMRDYIWLGLLSFSLIIYYAAIREARRREIRQHVSELFPHEKEMPLWIMIIAFIILNVGFTLPAYEKYAAKKQMLEKEYKEMMTVSGVVNNIKQSASSVSQDFMNSETMRMFKYYMNSMFVAPGNNPTYSPQQQQPLIIKE